MSCNYNQSEMLIERQSTSGVKKLDMIIYIPHVSYSGNLIIRVCGNYSPDYIFRNTNVIRDYIVAGKYIFQIA